MILCFIITLSQRLPYSLYTLLTIHFAWQIVKLWFIISTLVCYNILIFLLKERVFIISKSYATKNSTIFLHTPFFFPKPQPLLTLSLSCIHFPTYPFKTPTIIVFLYLLHNLKLIIKMIINYFMTYIADDLFINFIKTFKKVCYIFWGSFIFEGLNA